MAQMLDVISVHRKEREPVPRASAKRCSRKGSGSPGNESLPFEDVEDLVLRLAFVDVHAIAVLIATRPVVDHCVTVAGVCVGD